MPFLIVRDDIARVSADAIVNAANTRLQAGGGVCGALFAAAGAADMQAACDAIGGCPTGSAVSTPAFALDAMWVIHAVGPIWRGGLSGEREALRKSEMEEDIRRFKEYFPDITAADIPEEVWAEVAQGVSLTHAYALYRAAAGAADAKARSLNRVNAERSAPLGTEGDPTDALTQEQVENMSPQAVKKNYNRILASMRNWRL